MIERLIRTHIKGLTARRSLDVGPGYAHFSRVAAEVTGAREITFVDVDPKVLAWQTEQSQKHGISAVTVHTQLSATSVSALDGPFDLIHCQEVLEHIPDASGVLTELRMHLSPSGRIIITVPTKASEQWLKFLNPSYMKNKPFGHINEYDRQGLAQLLTQSGLTPCVMIPTQPHYFLAHSWFYGVRMQSEASTGRIITGGFRGFVFSYLIRGSRFFFVHTMPRFWGMLFPRNYFVIARASTRT